MQNCENMENIWKIKVFRKPILFCKYLRNGSSDLYEILCGGEIMLTLTLCGVGGVCKETNTDKVFYTLNSCQLTRLEHAENLLQVIFGKC